MPPVNKTICIDFDAVISKYDSWKGRGVFGDPIPGAIDTINKLKEDKWIIIIFTTRGGTTEEVDQLKSYLNKWSIPYDFINKNNEQPEGTNKGKPFADIYLDDRGLTFKGNWKESYKQIKNFKPYYK